jgi:hypothetical protein
MTRMPMRTPNSAESPINAEPEPDGGCAFVLDVDTRITAGRTFCAALCRPGSAYCHAHHAVCHLPSESLAERRKIKEIEALAEAVGGKSGRSARCPPPSFLQRMNRVSRAALRQERSLNVLQGGKTRRENRGAHQ